MGNEAASIPLRLVLLETLGFGGRESITGYFQRHKSPYVSFQAEVTNRKVFQTVTDTI